MLFRSYLYEEVCPNSYDQRKMATSYMPNCMQFLDAVLLAIIRDIMFINNIYAFNSLHDRFQTNWSYILHLRCYIQEAYRLFFSSQDMIKSFKKSPNAHILKQYAHNITNPPDGKPKSQVILPEDVVLDGFSQVTF